MDGRYVWLSAWGEGRRGNEIQLSQNEQRRLNDGDLATPISFISRQKAK